MLCFTVITNFKTLSFKELSDLKKTNIMVNNKSISEDPDALNQFLDYLIANITNDQIGIRGKPSQVETWGF